MMRPPRTVAHAVSFLLIATGLLSPAESAQDYPTRPVTLVVPFAPGGGADSVARIIAPKLSTELRQSLVIENKAGGGTLIAASSVAKATPDGYTLLLAPSGTLAINPTLYRKLPYDAERDFAPIALLVTIPLVLVVNPQLPVKSVAELAAFSKTNRGGLSFGSSGVGSSLHLAGELLKSLTGAEMVHVPYRGGAQALADVVAGHLSFMFNEPSSSMAQINSANVRALGVSSTARIPSAPEIPTIAESGTPGFEIVSWLMLLAPANTPREVVQRLHAQLHNIMTMPEVQEQIINIGMVPLDSPPVEDMERFIHTEINRWAAIVRDAGIAGSE